MMMTETDVTVDKVVNSLVRLVQALNDVEGCRVERDELLIKLAREEGLPKTGQRSAAAVVQARCRERGWDDAMIEKVGISEARVRQILERS